MANKDVEQQALIEQLRGARTVDFTEHVRAIYARLKMIENDLKDPNINLANAAKAYAKGLETELRHAIQPLYASAAAAYPEDNIQVGSAHSSFGPMALLEQYEFRVIVKKR